MLVAASQLMRIVFTGVLWGGEKEGIKMVAHIKGDGT